MKGIPTLRRAVVCLAAAGTLCAPAGAAGPSKVRKMDAVAIQAVSERDLCDALAVYASEGRRFPGIDAEVRRRNITCAEALERSVSDCSMLTLLAMEGSPAQGGTIFTVRNGSAKHKTFRIYYLGFQSSLFKLRPGETRPFGVAVDPRLGRIAGTYSALKGDNAPFLNECVTASWLF